MGNKTCKCEKIPLPQQPSPPKSSPPKPSPQQFSSFEEEILHYHNKVREENGLTPLVWDKALQVKAQDWAKFLVERDQNGMCTIEGHNRHPGEGARATPKEKDTYLPNNWGQNIYQGNGLEISPKGAILPKDPTSPLESVKAWYQECKDYTNKMDKQGVPVGWYNSEKPIGHFTQLMWKDAKKLGCASFPCKGQIQYNGTQHDSKGHVYVCNYDKGNVAGQFEKETQWPVKCSTDFLKS